MADLLKWHDLCNVLGLNLLQLIQDEVDGSVTDVDSWLASDLSAETTDILNSSFERLCKLKSDRFSELKKKASAILQFWDMLLVPFEKKQEFISLVYYVRVESDSEINEMSALSLDFFNKVTQEHEKLREEMNELILKKKSKLHQILKTTHLLSNVVDKDVDDPIAAFLDMKAQISEAQNLACQRADIVAKMEFVQYAVEEVHWHKESENASPPLQDERSIKALTLQKGLPKILRNLKAELACQAEPFMYDEGDALKTLMRIEDKATSTGIITNKTLDKAGTSSAVAEPTLVLEDMEVEPAEVIPLQPAQVLPLQPAPVLPAQAQPAEVLPLQPARLLPLFPLPPPQFGFVPRLRRTTRVPVVVPAPPSPGSNGSDASMEKSDSGDADYDPTQDLSDTASTD